MVEEELLSSLAGITIYIYQDSFFASEPVVGTLHVLDATTDTEHYAGHHSQARTIEFWVLDVTTFTTLETAMADQTIVALTDWLGATVNVSIKDLRPELMTDIKRPPKYAVYRCTARLLRS